MIRWGDEMKNESIKDTAHCCAATTVKVAERIERCPAFDLSELDITISAFDFSEASYYSLLIDPKERAC